VAASLTGGYHLAFGIAAGLVIVAIGLSAVLLRRPEVAVQELVVEEEEPEVLRQRPEPGPSGRLAERAVGP